MGPASQALSARGLQPDLCPAPFPPPQSPQTPCHHVLPGLPLRPSCTCESQALPCPRPHGRSGGCHLACRFSSCTFSCHCHPYAPPPSTENQAAGETGLRVFSGGVCGFSGGSPCRRSNFLPLPKVSPSSTPWWRQSAEELDGRGRSVALDQRSFRKVTWHLMPTWCLATPSWFGVSFLLFWDTTISLGSARISRFKDVHI